MLHINSVDILAGAIFPGILLLFGVKYYPA
jgi:hypothetical protein